ncbi:MAG: hypothetical protein D6808_00735 [Candidatus Dadabacteria bacterium]|nr:MAG: hypothetical protein D6808_00735 [Candidatus Dadabacteria bacterium]
MNKIEFSFPAYAKINWTLEVVGNFPPTSIYSGYKKIKSTLFLLDLHDKVRVAIKDSGERRLFISCTDPNVPQSSSGNISDNTVALAVSLLRDLCPDLSQCDISIEIDKRIPLCGGLGGSSTDAGAFLYEINKALNLGLSADNLQEIAGRIGSDVPFFASRLTSAIISGTGAEVASSSSFQGKVSVILVYSGVRLLAKDVYGGIDCADKESLITDEFISRLPVIALEDACKYLTNDLEKSDAIKRLFPELFSIKEGLLECGCLGALMSGSGCVVFGVYDGDPLILERVKRSFPEYGVVSAKIIDKEELI